MVFPILARVGARAIIPFLGRITPTIGRRIILPVGRGALGLGKFVGRRFIEKPLKTTGIITTGILGAGVLAASPIARRKVTRAPKTIFEKGGVIGAGIEQIAAGEKEAGLTAIQKGLIGAGIAGTAGAAAIAGARAIKKKKQLNNKSQLLFQQLHLYLQDLVLLVEFLSLLLVLIYQLK